jgi:catechol 2,3-dioxygenase-like lactoylglutathione lyase family enzyme
MVGAVIPARIGLVTLGVRDLAAAADFYERLGWPRRGEAASGVVLFETARAAGATIVAEPHATEWGGRVCLFADPDGNLWELLGRDASR